MKYMLLIYGNADFWGQFDPEEFKHLVDGTEALHAELKRSGELVGAYGVAEQENTKQVRVVDGAPAVTDGPYIEMKEYLASFTILDCESLDRALEIAALNPASKYVPVEIRPLMHESSPEL